MTAHADWQAASRTSALLMVALLGARPAWSASTSPLAVLAAMPERWQLAALLLSLALVGLGLVWWRQGRRRWQPSALDAIESAPWPLITVLLPAQSGDPAFSRGLQALLVCDYPPQCLRLVPISAVDDVQTGAIVNAYAHLYPERVLPCHVQTSAPDKAPALSAAMPLVEGDVLVVLQSAHIPEPGFFKALVKPFFDPEVGLVLGQATAPPADTRQRLWHRLFPARAPLPCTGAVRLTALQALGASGPARLDHLALLRQPLQSKGWRTQTQRLVRGTPLAAAPPRTPEPAARAGSTAAEQRSSSASDTPLPSGINPVNTAGPRTTPSSMEHA